MSDEKRYDPPATTTKGDVGYAAIKLAIGSVPIVGAAAVELLQLIVAPPMEKRREAWIEEIVEGLRKLEQKNLLTVESLSDNEAFIDAVAQATSAAMKTSSQVKLDALRNAVLNSATRFEVGKARQEIFINWIDSLTEWHLIILRLFADPIRWYTENRRDPPRFVLTSSPSTLLSDAYPELKNQRPLYDKLWSDLFNDGLVNTDSLNINMSAAGAFEKRATELGRGLLEFIADPTV
jgi:hypothetical protein